MPTSFGPAEREGEREDDRRQLPSASELCDPPRTLPQHLAEALLHFATLLAPRSALPAPRSPLPACLQLRRQRSSGQA